MRAIAALPTARRTCRRPLVFARLPRSWRRRTSNPAVRLQALAQAQAAAARATQTADDPFNAWYNLAAVRRFGGDSAAAEGALRRAIAARPNWFKPHWTLARLLLLESRTAEAEPEAALALTLDGGKDPDVSANLSGRSRPVAQVNSAAELLDKALRSF